MVRRTLPTPPTNHTKARYKGRIGTKDTAEAHTTQIQPIISLGTPTLPTQQEEALTQKTETQQQKQQPAAGTQRAPKKEPTPHTTAHTHEALLKPQVRVAISTKHGTI